MPAALFLLNIHFIIFTIIPIKMAINRCNWAKHKLEIEYHDKEWGVPVHDDRLLFEYFVLDAFQAGLSWLTILKKRNNFKKAFDNFDYEKIAKYNQAKINALLSDEGIIRNKLKVLATINNAKVFMTIQKRYGSFDNYIWQFVDHKPIINKFSKNAQIPANTNISDLMSKDLKNQGFKFVGSTICYSFMQAAGLVNDHLNSCFTHDEV
jgi:DNA-3-methyladenine glycosylase I